VQAVPEVTDARDVEDADAVPVTEGFRSRVGVPAFEVCGSVGPIPPGRSVSLVVDSVVSVVSLAVPSAAGTDPPRQPASEARPPPPSARPVLERRVRREGNTRDLPSGRYYALEGSKPAAELPRWRPIAGWREPKVELR
jgi:hypothetical protein